MTNLGYYGCDRNYPLIQDIQETFGDDLTEMKESDLFWLLTKISHHSWETYCSDAQSDAADEICKRSNELKNGQIECFVLALVNHSERKPLGYWGCDYSNRLILDISETFADNLQELPQSDRCWLISRLSSNCWLKADGDVSEAAEEIEDRLHELPESQIESLLQAFANL